MVLFIFMTLIFLKDPQKKKFTSELEKKNPNTIFTKIVCFVFKSLRHKKEKMSIKTNHIFEN